MPETRLIATTALRDVMDHQGRSVTWLGQQIGLTRSMASLIVNGERSVSLHHASMISVTIGVPVGMLFEEVGK